MKAKTFWLGIGGIAAVAVAAMIALTLAVGAFIADEQWPL